MGHVAVASPRRMSIVVHDEPTSPTEHCGGRKGRRLNLCEVLDALGGFGELGQSDNRYVEVRGGVQGVSGSRKLRPSSPRTSSAVELASALNPRRNAIGRVATPVLA